MLPELSIGVPSLNAGRFLREAVASIFAQTFTDWELIVVDDGSSDGSFSTLAGINDRRLRIYSDGRHRGLAARLNQITGLASGKYIARMDADDLCHPRRFEMQLEFLRRHAEIDGVGTALLSFDRKYRVRGQRTFPAEMNAIAADPLHGIRIAHATFCGRRRWFEQHPYNEENLCVEDWELWQRSYRNSRFANLPEPLYFYREFDSFRLRKYVRAQAGATRMQWAIRRQFGSVKAALACVRNFTAVAAYSSASAVGLADRLIARRSRHAGSDAQKEFDAALKAIRSAQLLAASREMANVKRGNQ
jgi:glycosyltransferase involved in cell wall biosynthesis